MGLVLNVMFLILNNIIVDVCFVTGVHFQLKYHHAFLK